MNKIPKPVAIAMAVVAVLLALFGISRSMGGNSTTMDKPMAPPPGMSQPSGGGGGGPYGNRGGGSGGPYGNRGR